MAKSGIEQFAKAFAAIAVVFALVMGGYIVWGINDYYSDGSSGGGDFRSCTHMTIGGQSRYDCSDYDGACKNTFVNGQYIDMWVSSKTEFGFDC